MCIVINNIVSKYNLAGLKSNRVKSIS
ncbi:hypothetical protein Zm00014a_012033 [Zea mays]|uniref:Uncharacterized protein n=1 Tax=Zea mays TaxID=4577 RepID=A0A3L6DMG2_MAIZE|nr:hypothetical protein Zm00014a_012033 [Zea mays]